MKRKVWITLLLLIMQQAVTGQLLDYNRISTDDGLASNFVNATYLDEKGFLWIATESGVQRYDGKHFLSVIPKNKIDKTSITHVHQIIGGQGSYLWLRIGNSIQQLHTGTFEFTPVRFKFKGTINIHNGTYLWADSRKHIFLIVYGGPVLMYDEAAKVFAADNLPFDVPQYPVNHIFEDTLHHRYWLSTDSGLYVSEQKTGQIQSAKYNPARISILNTDIARKPVNMLFIDSERRYWVMTDNKAGTNATMICYNEHQRKFTADTVGMNSPNLSMLTRMAETKNGGLWMYGGELLKNRSPVNGIFESQKLSLPFEFGIKYKEANFLLEDKNGCVWVATDHGLYFTLPEPTKMAHWDFAFDNKVILPDDRTLSLYQAKDRSIFYGRRKTGLNIYDYKHQPLYTINSMSTGKSRAPDNDYNCVQSIFQTKKDGVVWGGCINGKVIYYNAETEQIIFSSIPEFKDASLSEIVEDEQGNLWVGLSDGKLFRRSVGASKFELVESYEKAVNHILIDKEGVLWIAVNSDGVYAIDGRANRRLYHLSDREDAILGLQPQQQRLQQHNDAVLQEAIGC